MLAPVGFVSYTYPAAGVNAIGNATSPIQKINAIPPVGEKNSITVEKTPPSECQSCKNRKYMDRSNDNSVSFQTPTHVSPKSSFAAVSSHEQEHVANAVSEGNKNSTQLISASVSLKMAVCPECGTPYVAGGTTRTQIKYNESNPYENARKSVEGSLLKGLHFDAVA